MKYPDGLSICLGDKVRIGKDSDGTVVCAIETNEYSDAYPKAEWGYLNRGVLISFPLYGLIYWFVSRIYG